MMGFVEKLGRGFNCDKYDIELKDVFDVMVEYGIVYETIIDGNKIYKLCKNAHYKKDEKGYTFDVEPNRYMGVVFDYDEIFECVSENKEVDSYLLVYALNPNEEEIEHFGLGSKIKLKVIARGYNNENEGLLIRLPSSDAQQYKMKNDPFLTIGLKEGGKSKNTRLLNFDEPIKNKFIEGRKVLVVGNDLFFDISKVSCMIKRYKLTYNNYNYKIEKLEDKYLINKRKS